MNKILSKRSRINKNRDNEEKKEYLTIQSKHDGEYTNGDKRDEPILFILLSFGLSYGIYYIANLFTRINQHYNYDISIFDKINLYAYLFPLCIVCTCLICLYTRICFDKKNFLRFITLYIIITYLLFAILSYLILYLGFMGYGSASIFSFRPFLILWGFIAAIPNKFTIISLTFFIFWTFVFYTMPINKKFQIQDMYAINNKIFIILVLSMYILGFYLNWNDMNGIITITLVISLVFYLSFNYQNKKFYFNTKKYAISLFFIYTIFPLLFLYTIHSKFLLNFAYK